MKIRRRTLVLIAGALTLTIGLVLAAGAAWLLKSRSGLAFVRGQVVGLITGRVRGGHVYVGNISGSVLGRPTIDSIEIRDLDDSVLVATGPITFEYDILDLWDKRIVARNVVVERPYFHVRHDKAGVWNYKKLFAHDPSAVPSLPRMGGRKLGDVLLFENVTLHDGRFTWTEPWGPAPYFRGAARDSVIRYNLARKDADVKRVGRDLWRTRYWRNLQLVATHVRIKDPSVPGIAVQFSLLDVDEFDPPFIVRGGRGHVLYARDTVRLSVDNFRLPGSSGSASGLLFTKRGLGVRVRVIGDTVSMADIAWIYPTLPKDGGGRMTLDIRKDSTNDHIDYALTKMDVTSTKSHLRGAMTFGAGQEILQVSNVDLDLAPVDFKLIETFNGGPLALPWAGQLTGHVYARGGPLNQFFVDSTAITFVDGNVPGVVNRFTGHGELDIVRPLYTTFHDFFVNAQHFDLRTAQAVDSLFPPWKGYVYGTARLDSIWTDVRFREGDIRYAADSSPPSHFTGAGRVTVGEVEMIYDVALNADPVHLEAFQLAYPGFPMRGTFTGPFSLKGSMSNLTVSGDATGEGVHARTSGLWMNALGPTFGIRGAVELSHLDPSRVFTNAANWTGDLSGVLDAAMSGDSLSKMTGGLKVTLNPRSTLAGVRIQGGYSRLTFGEGLVRVDSLSVSSDALSMRGAGALGLHAGRRDSLALTIAMDSLGGIRALLGHAADSLPPVTMTGAVNATLHLIGNIDSLDARIGVRATDVAYGTITAHRAGLDGLITDLFRTRKGDVTLNGVTVGFAGVAFTSVDAHAALKGYDTARVTARMVGEKGPIVEGGANVSWDTVAVRTLLDSLHVGMGDHDWRLTRPTRLVSTRDAFTVDSIEIRSGANARLMLDARLPLKGDVRGVLRADAFPLGDFGKLFPVTIPVSGAAALAINLSGTRDAPVLAFEMLAQDATLGETRVEGLRATGDYRDRLLNTKVEYRRNQAVVLRADARLPLDLALKPVPKRLRNAPLAGTLAADSTDLAVLESFSSAIKRATGALDAHLTLSGTWDEPRLDGALRVVRGSMQLPKLGVRYDGVNAQVRFLGDSIQIDSVVMRSDGGTNSMARLFGSIGLSDIHNPSLNLRFTANRFHAIGSKDIADLTLTTISSEGLRIVGNKSSSSLSGGVVVNGDIYVPETYSKGIIALDERDYTGGVDTAAIGGRRLVPSVFSSFVDNMQIRGVSITAGQALWLRSEEANVQLAGDLSMSVVSSNRPSDRGRRFPALTGSLAPVQGTYRLNLGLVQRTFTVENTGSVTFFGDVDNIPTLDITGLYTVRQYDQRDARQDVRVRVNVGGTLTAPRVRLSSPDSVRISTADLYAYLLTGGPSLEIGGRNSEYKSALYGTLITSAGSVFGSRLGGLLSLDEVDLTTAGLTGYSGSAGKVTGNVLRGTRFRGGKQLRENLFLRMDAGLCQFGQLFDNTAFDIAGFANTLGFKADLRLTNGLSVSAGLEPPTSALLCAQGVSARGFVLTPRQWGIDFVRIWRF